VPASPVTVSLEMTTITLITSPGDLVRVEVTDDGAATVPMVYQACGEDEDGRGMQLVSALASAWSCHRDGSRTTTWFELAPRPQCVDARPVAGACTRRPLMTEMPADSIPPLRTQEDTRTPPQSGGAESHACRQSDAMGDVQVRAAGAAGPAPMALPRRIHGVPRWGRPGRTVQPPVGPETLQRVLDGLNRL
jgi:hypothetical protein